MIWNLNLKVHVKHKSLSSELQSHRDADAKNKADLKRIRDELEMEVAEFPQRKWRVGSTESRKGRNNGDRTRDKQRNKGQLLRFNQKTGCNSCQLVALRRLHYPVLRASMFFYLVKSRPSHLLFREPTNSCISLFYSYL
ncbi:PREDICTED: E3 ubiquitin-protein ligase BRE1-like 1 [Tarenaya hassleriana]|uniref:E3 ubiquitin-protein ligase BRE1-like 1 n=1 Tax=Tarenaya hassleriana TaxID=28532 RepID=UPI00053CA181|nr:PREDICTED: E3 ubiquitin-protein ligase BRE1-like 1 [Tarenaya hassleriana]